MKIELPESKIDRSMYYGTKELREKYERLRDEELDAAGIPMPPLPDPELAKLVVPFTALCDPRDARRKGFWMYGPPNNRTLYPLGSRHVTDKLTRWSMHESVDAWGHVTREWSYPGDIIDGVLVKGTEVSRQLTPPPSYRSILLKSVPSRFASVTWNEIDGNGERAIAVKACKRWVESVKAGGKPSMWLTGQPGRGKTQMSFLMILDLADSDIAVERHDMADIVRDLRMTYESEAKDRKREKFEQTMLRAERAKILILDDVGAEMGGDDVRAVLHRLVDYRWENELPTLVTSNFTPEQLGAEAMGKKRLDARIVSRFSSYFTVTVGGPDFRQGA